MGRVASPLAEGENLFQKRIPKSERVPFGRRNGLKRGSLKRAGRKVKQWESIRAVLKKMFAAAGIASCELNLSPDCWRDNALGFLHTKKRRNCTEADLWVVALGCNICHDAAELLPESEMEALVLGVIAARAVQP